MSAAALTSITDFLLAGETFLFAWLLLRLPKRPFSAAWYWTGLLWTLGLGALLGAAVHAYSDPAGKAPVVIEKIEWIVFAAMTFCLFLATVKQFVSPKYRWIATFIALAQFLFSLGFVLSFDSFLVVMAGYTPVACFLLVLNAIAAKRGAGIPALSIGLFILLAASAVQASGFDRLSPVDHNVIYHLISMAGVYGLYLGGTKLDR